MAGSVAKLYAESEIREAKQVINFHQKQLLLAEEKIKREFEEECEVIKQNIRLGQRGDGLGTKHLEQTQ